MYICLLDYRIVSGPFRFHDGEPLRAVGGDNWFLSGGLLRECSSQGDGGAEEENERDLLAGGLHGSPFGCGGFANGGWSRRGMKWTQT